MSGIQYNQQVFFHHWRFSPTIKKINQYLRTLSLTFAFQDREAKLIYKNAEVLKINNVITIQLQWIVGQKIMLWIKFFYSILNRFSTFNTWLVIQHK